jgi:hypothetical protein
MAWRTIRVLVARMAAWQGVIWMGNGLDDYVLSKQNTWGFG